MKVSQLYSPQGPFAGRDFYIVGSGASLTVFPRQFLRDKLCVLLNDTCRHAPELGPIAFCNNREQLKFAGPSIRYRVVKGRLKWNSPLSASQDPTEDDNHVRWDDPDHWVFSYREPPWDDVSHHDENTLWKEPCHYWAPRHGSVSAFASQFAIHAGAKSITLIGCDCATLNGEHYVSGKREHQHRHDYDQYLKGLRVMWREATARGIPMMSLQPFFGVREYEEQFKDMERWLRTHRT